jgi:heme oxygenase
MDSMKVLVVAESYGLLKKRVRMILTSVEESTRITFNQDILLKILFKQSNQKHDDGYVREMFFSIES